MWLPIVVLVGLGLGRLLGCPSPALVVGTVALPGDPLEPIDRLQAPLDRQRTGDDWVYRIHLSTPA
jgi:hypothetical protein